MTVKTYTTTEVVTEVTEFPAYFQHGDHLFAKAIDEKTVIYVYASPYTQDCMLEIRNYLGSNYVPMPDGVKFYETAARAMQRINAGCDIISLELEGGNND